MYLDLFDAEMFKFLNRTRANRRAYRVVQYWFL